MSTWYMLTLVGEDQPGIVAAVTQALFDKGMNLGEASMLRLGGNFTVMIMVSGADDVDQVRHALAGPVEHFGLRMHVDAMMGGLHRHMEPNVLVRVVGADRAGIVAQVAGALAEQGMNILDLESDVAGTEDEPLYIMQIAGLSEAPAEKLDEAMSTLREQGVDVSVESVQTLLG